MQVTICNCYTKIRIFSYTAASSIRMQIVPVTPGGCFLKFCTCDGVTIGIELNHPTKARRYELSYVTVLNAVAQIRRLKFWLQSFPSTIRKLHYSVSGKVCCLENHLSPSH